VTIIVYGCSLASQDSHGSSLVHDNHEISDLWLEISHDPGLEISEISVRNFEEDRRSHVDLSEEKTRGKERETNEDDFSPLGEKSQELEDEKKSKRGDHGIEVNENVDKKTVHRNKVQEEVRNGMEDNNADDRTQSSGNSNADTQSSGNANASDTKYLLRRLNADLGSSRGSVSSRGSASHGSAEVSAEVSTQEVVIEETNAETQWIERIASELFRNEQYAQKQELFRNESQKPEQELFRNEHYAQKPEQELFRNEHYAQKPEQELFRNGDAPEEERSKQKKDNSRETWKQKWEMWWPAVILWFIIGVFIGMSLYACDSVDRAYAAENSRRVDGPGAEREIPIGVPVPNGQPLNVYISEVPVEAIVISWNNDASRILL